MAKDDIVKFIFPSLAGLSLFLIPVPTDGSFTIIFAILVGALKGIIGDYLTALIVTVVICSAALTVWYSWIFPNVTENGKREALFQASPYWAGARILGAVFAVLIFWQASDPRIWGDATGGLLLNDLLPTIFCVFVLGGLLVPLILNFGLLEFIGVLLSKIMRPLFNLPGRAAVDCTTSWLGDGTLGILLTNRQYVEKVYTQKEAAIVATTFSASSITFSLVIISEVGMLHMFGWFYLTVCIAGIVAAMIVPRLPPLCFKKDCYIDGSYPSDTPQADVQSGLFRRALSEAVARAERNKSVRDVLFSGVENMMQMLFTVLPVVMAMGTLALILAEYTPVFDILAWPFLPLLELLNVADLSVAAKASVIGFADMYLPALLVSQSQDELTRFVIASLSMTQLIYLSEVGAMLLGCRLPLNILDLLIIFVLRTIVTLPVIAGIGHLIF